MFFGETWTRQRNVLGHSTCNDHHADGEHLLVVCLRGDIAEANLWRERERETEWQKRFSNSPKVFLKSSLSHRCHARHGEVQRRHVHTLPGRAVDQLGTRVVTPDVRVRRLRHIRQLPQPAVLDLQGIEKVD